MRLHAHAYAFVRSLSMAATLLALVVCSLGCPPRDGEANADPRGLWQLIESRDLDNTHRWTLGNNGILAFETSLVPVVLDGGYAVSERDVTVTAFHSPAKAASLVETDIDGVLTISPDGQTLTGSLTVALIVDGLPGPVETVHVAGVRVP